MVYLRAVNAPSYLQRFLASSEIKTPGFILDVDEDFYGVMRGSDMLGVLNFDHVFGLNHMLAKSLDVRTAQGNILYVRVSFKAL